LVVRLAAWLGTTPDLWLGMQAQWELWQAEQQPRPKIQTAGADGGLNCVFVRLG